MYNNANCSYECGDGWLPLIEDAKTIIAKYNLYHPILEEKLEFVQIKEKWGELRLYLNQYIPEVEEKIHKLEEKSLDICEQCGTDKNVKTEWTHGWIMTLCDNCRNEEMKKYNERFNVGSKKS